MDIFKKINAAHAIGGIELLKEKLEGMLGIKIDYYVKVDYKAFRELIDAVGGIDVVIERDMNYNAHDIQVHFKKGEKVHLDEKRLRHLLDGERIMMEQDMLWGI